jgi:hypothetical protein
MPFRASFVTMGFDDITLSCVCTYVPLSVITYHTKYGSKQTPQIAVAKNHAISTNTTVYEASGEKGALQCIPQQRTTSNAMQFRPNCFQSLPRHYYPHPQPITLAMRVHCTNHRLFNLQWYHMPTFIPTIHNRVPWLARKSVQFDNVIQLCKLPQSMQVRTK